MFNYKQELDNIEKDWVSYQNDIIIRTQQCLNLASSDLGDLFLSKGYIHVYENDNNYYYDEKSQVGVKLELDKHIYLDVEYNSISGIIVYKVRNKFLEYNKKFYFKFKEESTENSFKRFLVFTKNSPLYNMKNYLRNKYPTEMMIDDRREKLDKLNNE